MLGISGLGIGAYDRNPYGAYFGVRGAARQSRAGAVQAPAAARGAVMSAAIPAAQPDVPVQPVSAAPAADAVELDRVDLMRRWENDPAAMAVRGRIRYMDGGQPASRTDASGAAQQVYYDAGPAQTTDVPGTLQLGRGAGAPGAVRQDPEGVRLPGYAADAEGKTVDVPIKNAGEADKSDKPGQTDKPGEAKSAQEIMEESECQTCKNRKYQDGSDDPGVSFKSPTHIDPDMAGAAVRGHEMEHVVREQASARQEDRRVLSQSVTYHTAICPECGRVYVSGGTTRTTTAAQQQEEDTFGQQEQDAPQAWRQSAPELAGASSPTA